MTQVVASLAADRAAGAVATGYVVARHGSDVGAKTVGGSRR
jgi:hypothetical protein